MSVIGSSFEFLRFFRSLSGWRSPLLEQEGWLRIKKISRSHPLKAQTGWSVQNDHPVCAFKGGFATFS